MANGMPANIRPRTHMSHIPSKVLITGGAGFIGSTTVETLLERNIPVRVLDNFSSGRLENLDDGNPLLEIVTGDVRDRHAVDQSMQDISHCLHLAAQVSVPASLEDPVNSAKHNIIGFLNVLDSAKSHAVKRFVYASSAAVYGSPEEIPLPENSRLAPMSPYGLEKSVNENYASLYAELYGLSCLGLRYFNVYGPRQDPASPYAGVITRFVSQIKRGQNVTVFGDGQQTRDFIYVEDVARANCHALQNDLHGACNIGTGHETSLIQLIRIIARLTECEPETVFQPPKAGDIKHSLADVTRMEKVFAIQAKFSMEQGLAKSIDLLAV